MPNDLAVSHAIGGKLQDGAVAELAERQHGVVARRQLLAIGMNRRALEWRIANGRLHPIHRGVYAVGHRKLTQKGRWMAAVLTIGDKAVLSHRSAAALWGLLPTSRTRIEVSVPRNVRSRREIEVHWSGG